MLANLFRRLTQPEDTARQAAATALHRAIVAQSRQPGFYAALGVPDTLEGRYEVIALHGAAVMTRLSNEGEAAEALNQALFDAIFIAIDDSLREMGVGDLKVGKRVKDMAQALHGRAVAFEQALQAGDSAVLEDAVLRNTYHMDEAQPEPAQISAMAAYLRAITVRLAGQDTESLMAGMVDFGPQPAIEAASRGGQQQ